MKTQIIKIIPCLLAGFILSACVGAVNLSDGTIAESKTENTDDSLDPKSIVIDDKEPEPIVSEPAHPCIATPFSDTCGGEEFNDAREAICLTERESHRCRAIIPLVCEADSLDILCAGDETYFVAQRITCSVNKTDPRCALTIERVCTSNPFDYFCNNKTYYQAKELICADELDSRRCALTIARVCDADSLDSLCAGNETYYPAQKRACRADNTNPRCAQTIRVACTTNPLDTLCDGYEAYDLAKKEACRINNIHPVCVPVIARVCSSDSSDTLCQLNNLTMHNIPKNLEGSLLNRKIIIQLNNLPVNLNLGKEMLYPYHSTHSGNKFFDPDCLVWKTCTLTYFDTISIKRLNDTNTGTATYAGSILIEYYCSACSDRIIDESIDIIANFDNNTLTYSGNLQPFYLERNLRTRSYIKRGEVEDSVFFNIDGKFTNKGYLTGLVTLDTNYKNLHARSGSREAQLVGLIGQNDVIGLFVAEGISINQSHRRIPQFAGGFTATREE